ncbi:MAG: MFS transporter [Candidatus Lambdaproteobacteria bacterium]|nr:MFS transporter [Candidatus Lambdaproteobacteria bacterium]
MVRTGGVLVGLCAVGFLARTSYALARTPVLALFAASLGAGPEAVGLAVAISTVTGVFFKLPAGVVSDVIGRRRTLFAGLAVFALVPLAYPFVESYAALVVVRFLHGFATAIYAPVAMAVVIGLAGARRAETLSWFSSVSVAGNLVGAPLGGLMLTLLAVGGANRIGDYHLVYGVVAALGAAALLLALWAVPREAAPAAPGEHALAGVLRQFRTGAREILLDRRVLATSNMEGMQNLAVGALEAFLPLYAVLVAGLTPLEAGLLWGVQVVATVSAKPWLGRWSDRIGRVALIFWGMFACAVPFALIPWFTGFPALLVLAATLGLGVAVVTSSTAALVADLCQESQLGSAMGAFGTIFDVGHAAGPLLAGFLIAAFGGHDYRAPFALIAAILVVSAIAFRRVMARAPAARPVGEPTG